jgi:NADP-dependent 3-hydroxy acid dehydrogenase YdfG
VLSRNEIRDLCDVKVHRVINVTQACRDSMRKRGGGVVLSISSAALAWTPTSSPRGPIRAPASPRS